MSRNYSSWLSFKAQKDKHLDAILSEPDGDDKFPDIDSCECDYRNCNCKSMFGESGRFEEILTDENRVDDEAIKGRVDSNSAEFDSNDDIEETREQKRIKKLEERNRL